MSLRHRLESGAPLAQGPAAVSLVDDELKASLHRQLLERIDLRALEALPQAEVSAQLRALLDDMLTAGHAARHKCARCH
jgi:hypothetical protein